MDKVLTADDILHIEKRGWAVDNREWHQLLTAARMGIGAYVSLATSYEQLRVENEELRAEIERLKKPK